MLSNSGQNEWGGIYGGTPGDQTGREWNIVAWYSYPWNCVLRYHGADAREKIADLARAAANNDKIGYNQYNRNSYWTQLQKAKYNPANIKTACDADCSAGVIANVRAVGYLLNIDALKNISATYTGNMRSAFKAAGFQVLTDRKYLTGPDYLLAGDILLNDQNHTCTNLDNGSKAPGWRMSGGSWYYYKPDGSVAKSMWVMDSVGWCYCGSNGAAIKNQWLKWKGDWYYLDKNCHMLKNAFQKDTGGMCYVNNSGVAVKNQWVKVKNDWYYFNNNYHMVTNAFQNDSGGTCYLNGEGKAIKSQWLKKGNDWYYFDKSYHMVKDGYANDSHGKCYLGPDGKWDGKYVS